MTKSAFLLLASILSGTHILAQPETLLPRRTVVGLGNTVSGSRPLNVLTDIAGYNRDRQADEYGGTWHESEVLSAKAKEYGFSDVEILRYPRSTIWDGIRGELWISSPIERKIIDFKDIPTALAPGSVTGTYEGEMVWIDNASGKEGYENVDLEGKIVLSASSTRGAFTRATSAGALGVVNMNSPRPHVTPDAILWSSIARPQEGFAFNISAPILEDIKRQAMFGPLKLKAIVESDWREVDNEVITAVIPGDGSTDEWVYYSAHVYEGINKQGAADDGSGAVLILEAGRTIIEAIERGYVSRPARSMRFLWVDEFRGTNDFLNANPEEFSKVVADINIDMAGQNVTLNNNATRLYRMPDSRIHYVADVAQEFFEWVGLTNIERVHERRAGYGFSFPLIDPYGTRDAWRYVIEPFYGSSDHQVYNDRGVPAILFNHWPDMVYHTSHDRPKLMDSTQMKRTAFISAATGLVVAGAPEVDPQLVAMSIFSRGTGRIAEQRRSWTAHLASLPAAEWMAFYRDLGPAAEQWYKREQRNLASVLELGRGSTAQDPGKLRAAVEVLSGQLEALEKSELSALKSYFETVHPDAIDAVELELTPLELEANQRIPRLTGSASRRMRRPDLPGFSSMEVRNFINGERSILEIRNAVNSEYALEYGSISLDAVTAYIEALEKAKAVEIR